MNYGIHKASGLESLRKRFKGYKFIAFGDNYNDIELLQSADIAIVMKNAPKEVKKYADYITLSPMEDGIEYAINKYCKGI